MRQSKWLYLAVAVALLVGVVPANAQSTTGGIFIKASDNEGNPLPGVTITISGFARRQKSAKRFFDQLITRRSALG